VSLTVRDDVPLAPLTTLELGGPARHLVEARDDATVLEALRWAAARGLRVLVLGGGSNLVIGDGGFDGLVLRLATRGQTFAASDADGEVLATVAAGEPWDAFVAETVARGLAGLECLSGIPGLAGATPIQNVGAYGQEVAETIHAVQAVERATGTRVQLSPDDCAFAYRDSAFRRAPQRWVVLGVTFALHAGGAPTLRYRELADALPSTATLAEARATVLALRARKSMVIDPADPNRRSAGSFFTNPIVDTAVADALGPDAPRWPAGPGRVKLSAGWLIEHAGIAKGTRRGPVGVSTRHALALVHHGGGTTDALVALAREVRAAVASRLGVTLTPEPVFVGASLD
jgi:UDP-N-acetylmuramate dehydrogenase